MTNSKLFKMGGEIDSRTSTIIGIVGLIVIIAFWYVITTFGGISTRILPTPQSVFGAFGELQNQPHGIGENVWYSVKLNFMGYFEALLISIPLGFLIGLFPGPRALLSKWVDAVRFVPLTAVTGLFIGWFGIEFGMKSHFLGFGILIYLLPIIVQRIDEVKTIHLQTAYTIGANNWFTFKKVYFPSVMARISDDIRVITAISWTYIIVAEAINRELGVGAMIHEGIKQTRIEWVFAVLIIIIAVGYLQDKLFKYLDFIAFPYKYEKNQEKKRGFRFSKYIVKTAK